MLGSSRRVAQFSLFAKDILQGVFQGERQAHSVGTVAVFN